DPVAAGGQHALALDRGSPGAFSPGRLAKRRVVDQRDVLAWNPRERTAEVQIERGHLPRPELPELEQAGRLVPGRGTALHDLDAVRIGNGDQQVAHGLVRLGLALLAPDGEANDLGVTTGRGPHLDAVELHAELQLAS